MFSIPHNASIFGRVALDYEVDYYASLFGRFNVTTGRVRLYGLLAIIGSRFRNW